MDHEQTQGAGERTRAYAVNGLTCGHCASAVTEEVGQLPGVTRVEVELVAGGTSTVSVTADRPLDEALLSGALAEAGDYHLA